MTTLATILIILNAVCSLGLVIVCAHYQRKARQVAKGAEHVAKVYATLCNPDSTEYGIVAHPDGYMVVRTFARQHDGENGTVAKIMVKEFASEDTSDEQMDYARRRAEELLEMLNED